MSAPVRFAILGFGHHAVRRLVPAFAKCEYAVLTGIWRRNQAAAAEACATYAIPHCFESAEALCRSAEVDVVFITSPDAMHLDDALLAIRNGKAVLCEKPLAMNVNEAREIVEAAEAAGVFFGVGQNFRYNRSLQWMKAQIEAGRIGTPQLAHAQYCYPAANAPRRWITDPTLACGGPIADVGVHCIDSLRFVLGRETRVKSVSVAASKDKASGEVEAMATMQLELTGGVFANVTADARSPYRTLIEIVGSEGVLIGENCLSVDLPVEVVLRSGGKVVESATFENFDGYTRMLDGFALAYRGEGEFLANGPDSVHNQRVLDAAFRSWHNGLRETV